MITKDVASYSVVGGNPAIIIRKRFDDVTILRLLKLQWWRWSIEKITENANAIAQGQLDLLINSD